MKKVSFLKVGIICLMLGFAAEAYAQLIVKPDGTVRVRTYYEEEHPSFNYLPSQLDTITALRIYGSGYNATKARISFGDQLFRLGLNVMVGEAGNTDTDMLWLHGRAGICATADAEAADTLFSYVPLEDDALRVNTDIRTRGLLVASDRRFKTDIAEVENALEKLASLDAVSYRLKPNVRDNPDFSELEALAANDPKLAETLRQERAINAARTARTDSHYGFIAQDVEKTVPELVTTGNDGYKYVDYISVIPLLVNAVNELRAELAAARAQAAPAEGQPATQMAAPAQQPTGTHEAMFQSRTGAILYQNAPNPFSSDTEIRYTLPEGVAQAAIYIFDMQGKQVDRHDLAATAGAGSITVSGFTLQAGMYIYALIADGQEVDSKRMILTK